MKCCSIITTPKALKKLERSFYLCSLNQEVLTIGVLDSVLTRLDENKVLKSGVILPMLGLYRTCIHDG